VKRYRDITGDAGSNVSAQIGAQQARLHARMATVRAKLAIVSGKGGVGKSAIAANLSAAFAARGLRVGALDADLNGPCLAKMLGVREAGLAFEPGGVRPVRGPLGVRVVSMDLLLPSDDAPVVWRGPGEEGGHLWRGAAEVAALREFLADTEWGALDLLVLDLPPGTDRIPSLLALLPGLDGVVLVTLPSQVSHLIVAKSVAMVRDVVKAPILGLVENMGAFRCPQCHVEDALFETDGSAPMADRLGIRFLGSVPFDPALARCADRGVPVVLDSPESAAGAALIEIAGRIGDALGLCSETHTTEETR
jgi:ATP-binding protein involved in chromosome partitioning